MQEIANPIAVIRAILVRHIRQHRAQPNSPCTKPLDVRQLVLNAREVAALKGITIRIVKRRMLGWILRIIETIDHQKINPLVAPILRRWERTGRPAGIAISIEDAQEVRSIEGRSHGSLLGLGPRVYSRATCRDVKI